MPEVGEILRNPLNHPLLFIALILIWGGGLALIFAIFRVGTFRRAFGVILLGLVIFFISRCLS